MTQQNYDKKDPPGENNIKKKNQLGQFNPRAEMKCF